MKKKNWLITQAQIAAHDIDYAIMQVDPEQLSDAQIPGLHGAVRLRIEGTTGPFSIFGDPATRKYFQSLHTRWPYPGYFLRLKPITLDSPREQIVDLSVFMSLAFCHCDRLTYCETKTGVGIQYELSELSKILAEFQGRAAELADVVGIPTQEIEQRDNLIADAVASFFDAGKEIHQQKNQNRNRR